MAEKKKRTEKNIKDAAVIASQISKKHEKGLRQRIKRQAQKIEQFQEDDVLSSEVKAKVNKEVEIFEELPEVQKQRREVVKTLPHTISSYISTKQQKIEKRWQNFTLITLFFAPFIISIISAIHAFDLFLIGNFYFLAYFLAAAFEILAISALVSLRVLGILGAGAVRFVWIAIIFLASIQISGNIYSVYIKIDQGLATQMGELIGMEWGIPLRRLISCVLGSILPVTALIFLKVLASYWYKLQRLDLRIK